MRLYFICVKIKVVKDRLWRLRKSQAKFLVKMVYPLAPIEWKSCGLCDEGAARRLQRKRENDRSKMPKRVAADKKN
jgi:hypothetical protein